MPKKPLTISISDIDKKALADIQSRYPRSHYDALSDALYGRDLWKRMYDEEEPCVYIIGGKKVKNRAAIESDVLRRWLDSHIETAEQIRILEAELSRLRAKAINDAKFEMSMKSIFISHASEDKDAVARPLAEMLTDLSVHVWFDEYSLKLGDSLRGSIEKGIASCDFGVVILSKAFFRKNWTEFELDGLTSKEMLGSKVILPVWHEISAAEIIEVAPSLAGKVAAKTEDGLERIISLILDAIA